MALLNIPDLTNGTAADANDVNALKAAIAKEINGGLDSTNLADNAVATENLQDDSVTSAKLAPSKTVDANGWTVYDFGTFKHYAKKLSVLGLAVAASSRGQLPVTSLPVGRQAQNTHLGATYHGNYAGHVLIGLEGLTNGGTTMIVQVGNTYVGPLTFYGTVQITASDDA